MQRPAFLTFDAQPPENAAAVGPRTDRLLPSWRHVWLLYAAWLVPAVVFTGRSALLQGELGLGLWARSLVLGLWYWFYWATICPPAYRLYARSPVTRGKWLESLGVHLASALVAAAGVAILAALVRKLVLGQPEPLAAYLSRELVSRSAFALHILHLAKYAWILAAMALIRESRLRRASERQAAELHLKASQLEAQASSATLQALRNQLNPHFLFNALNSVQSLVRHGDRMEASRMISKLAGLLRQTLQGPSDQLLPLEQELRLVRRYLDLETLRFGERLRVETEIDPSCNSALVPPLVLQPLVENVVRHAVARQLDPVTLRIAAADVRGALELTVEDNGNGRPEARSVAHGAGLGLKTTAERLRLTYGDRCEFRAGPTPGGGFSARIRLPREPGREASGG